MIRIDGDCDNLVSSTTFIHGFFPEFDKNRIVGYILRGKKWRTDPSYKYYQLSKEEIFGLWDANGKQASGAGTVMHAAIEYHYNALDVPQASIETPEWSMFEDFLEDHRHLTAWRTEQMVFSESLRMTGSIDMQFRAPDGTIIMADWKRSKKITRKAYGGQKGYFPFDHLPNANYYHYALQLNLYRTFLETWYGEKVSQMFLLVLHPDQEKLDGNRYHKIRIPRMDEEAELMLEYRRQKLVEAGVLEEFDRPYVYKSAKELGLVPRTAANEVFDVAEPLGNQILEL